MVHSIPSLMVRIAAFPIIVSFHLSLQTGAEFLKNNTVFCETTSIDISQHVKSKVSGKIYSPNQPKRYYGGPYEQDRSCSLQITGLRDHYIIIEHSKMETLGPCLEDLKIGNHQTPDACTSYEQIYLRRENQDNKIVISVEITQKTQPEFLLSFKIYPLIILQSGMRFIDTTATPEGYLMSSPTLVDFRAVFTNFPINPVINIDIMDLHIDSSSSSAFNIDRRAILSGNDIIQPQKQLAYYDSSARYIPFRFAAQQHDSIMLLLPNLNKNSLGLLKYSTVAWCDYQIEHLKTLLPTSHIYNHTSDYMAECSAGYTLKNGDIRYTCDDNRWIPELECKVPLTTIRPNSRPTTHPVNSPDTWGSLSTGWIGNHQTILICGGLIVFGIIASASVAAIVSKYRKKEDDIPTTQKEALESSTTEQFRTTEADPEAGHAEHGYDIIDDVDPYVDYAEINQSEMMNHSFEPAYKPYLQPTSNPTYEYHIERCNQSNQNDNASPNLSESLEGGCSNPATCNGSKSKPTSPYHRIWDPKTKTSNQLKADNRRVDQMTPQRSRVISCRDRRSTPHRVGMNQTSRLVYTDDLVYADINQTVHDSPYLSREDRAIHSRRQEISRAPISLTGSSSSLAHDCGDLGERERDSRVDTRWQPAQLSRSQSMHCSNSFVV